MPKPPAGPSPELTALLAWTVAGITSVPLGRWGLNTDKPNDGAIARLVTELALLWERADLAARGVYHEGTGIVLLFRGEELLRADDARGAVGAALRAAGPPR